MLWFPKVVAENNNSETWLWLLKGILKRVAESLSVAAQDQALKTNYIKVEIDKKPQVDFQCKLCKPKEESAIHLVSECSMLA